MNLTIAERLRTRLLTGAVEGGAMIQPQTLALVEQLIAGVSAQAETYMDRGIQTLARTEYLDVESGQSSFRLRAFPITTITGVWFDADQAFAASSAIASTEYYSPVIDGSGLLRLKWPLLNWQPHGGSYSQALKVTYTGGMATDTAAFVAAYPDIAEAIDQQVTYVWMRRHDLGLTAVSGAGGSVTQPAINWLPSVKSVLNQYRRHHAA